MARASAACQRCRRRKQKCDLKYPSCSNCENASKPCLTYDPGKQTEIPRDYVAHLEAQVQKLNLEVQELRDRGRAPPASDSSHISSTTPTPADRSDTYDLETSVRDAVVEPSKSPRFLGPSSGITLARMVMASIRIDARSSPVPPHDHQASREQSVSSAPTSAEASSLPPRHAADHLINVYFEYRTPHLPIIQAAQARKAIDNAFKCANGNGQDVGPASDHDLFTSYMIFAIALCNVSSPIGGTGRPLQSEGCFRSALQWIEKVITYSKSDIETLRAVLLLTQFVSMCPWRGSLWHLTGIATRLCIDMGLHWETDEQATLLSQETLYERRRLWYSTRQFDCVLSITLGRPFGITEESSRVPLPNPWFISSTEPLADHEIHYQRAHNHLFALSRLEAEIRHVHHSHSQPATLAHPKPNYTAWLQDVRPRLQEWFSTIPNPSLVHPQSIFANQAYWDSIYNNAILLLHRRTPASASCFKAATALIANLTLLQRDGRLAVLWKSVHDIFLAGLTVILCVWQDASIRSAQPLGKTIASLQSCGSTLAAMAVNFQGAGACRDAFETLSVATVDWLVNGGGDGGGDGADEMGTLADLLHQHPLATGSSSGGQGGDMMMMQGGIEMMLSSESFGFGEMLSSAAQWPSLEGMMDGFAVEGSVMLGSGDGAVGYAF